MEEAIRAIAEPNRRRILQLVSGGELSAGEIASRFEITRPAVSQHLTVLREAGLVAERREGTRRLYSLRPEGFTDLRSFLEAFWEEGLERLKRAAEAEEKGRHVAVEQRSDIEREIRIAASPETVFDYFVDPDKMVEWKGRKAELDPRPGGLYRVDISDEAVARGEYVEIDAPSRV